MAKTLYAKLALALIALFAAVAIVHALVSLSATRHYLEKVNQELNRDLARHLVADRNLVAEGRLDQTALKQTFEMYMTINPSIEIYLLDLDGRILAFSADPGKVKRKQVALAPIRAFLEGETGYPLLGDDPRSHDRRKVFSVTPVPSAERPEGFLYVVLRGERFDTLDQLLGASHLLRLSGWALAGSLGLGLLAGLVIFRVLTRRLHRLTALMDHFRLSGFSRHDTYRAGRDSAVADEIDQLGRTFDQMAQRIVAQIDELKQQDAVRRDLVAQVSHDLRTPLAALHGYLETLQLKDGELGDDERSAHLKVAMRHSERLRRLVNELFDLAKLEARDERPKCEPFAATDLVQDVSQKFRLRADEHDTRLEVTVNGEVPLASGDIALVERVLENLIDNALTHTPAGGRVTIPVSSSAGHVVIAVSDTGRGIDEGDIPKIFDRYYQADGALASEDHSGLGLAIAKRIVDLHGSELEVTSQPGRGTTFQFALPAWQG